MDEWDYRPAQDLGLTRTERLRSLRREMGLLAWMANRMSWALIRTYLRLRHRLRVNGRERLPAEPPFVLVANHTSHLDAIVLSAALPILQRIRAFPIAAGDTFFTTDATATFAAVVLNALPMWRRRCGAHALEELRERLEQDACVYILFPEGTRAREGELGPFKAGIGRLIAGTPIPVVPCHIGGAFAAWPPNRKLPGPGRLTVTIGDPIAFPEVPQSRAGWNDVAEALRAAVSALAQSR